MRHWNLNIDRWKFRLICPVNKCPTRSIYREVPLSSRTVDLIWVKLSHFEIRFIWRVLASSDLQKLGSWVIPTVVYDALQRHCKCCSLPLFFDLNFIFYILKQKYLNMVSINCSKLYNSLSHWNITNHHQPQWHWSNSPNSYTVLYLIAKI